LHVLTPQGFPFASRGEPPWDFSPWITNRVGGPMGPLLSPTVWSAGVAAAVAVVLIALAWGPGARRARGARLALTATAGACLLAGGWVATVVFDTGWVGHRGFYPPYDDFYRGWIELERRSGPRGTRVAYAGTNIPWYLMGIGLRNDVRYVNIDEHRDWLMHDYHRRAIAEGRPRWGPYPRPGWDRERPDPDAWVANLKAEGIRLLVVTRVNVGEGPHNKADADGFPIERAWADDRPETFEPVYGVAERDPWMRIYRLRNDL
jgi:hypothetical protein